METRYVWIPEDSDHLGLYAADTSKTCYVATHTAEWALQFDTKEECQKWCDEHPTVNWISIEHGFD